MEEGAFSDQACTEDQPGVRPRAERVRFLGLTFDSITAERARALLAERGSQAPFGYVVTPNVQHVVGAERDPGIVPLMENAWLSLCDSRPVRRLGRWAGHDLPLVTGSDLTVSLFKEVIRPGDRIAVICPSERVSEALQEQRDDLEWNIVVPPSGCDPGTEGFARCVDFIAENRARFIFVCLGAPKSEAMCHSALRRQGVTGTALCVGASLEFMLGFKPRAPQIVQQLGLEWLHRMMSEPRRLVRRYASCVLPLAKLWLRELRRGSGS